MLRIERLSRRFGERRILDGLDLTLGAGDYVAVSGESGAGKSTFLNLIAGLDVPDAGRVQIGDAVMCDVGTVGDGVGDRGVGSAGNRAIDEDARTRLRRTRVGFVFQAFHVLPHLTVAQNVELPLVLLGVAPRERQERVQAMLEAVGLGARGASPPRELSGGELQRVAVARALVHRPALVLADEPTGNLDPDTAAGVLDLLASSIRTSGAAGILVTHSAAAARTADRVLRLDHGRLHPALAAEGDEVLPRPLGTDTRAAAE
jgi:putative ABC transport system ATP-binding protein